VQDIPYYSTLAETKYKLAVLVNENSASASEILTGAIKDTKAGVIIGTKTFGKAKVQGFIPILSPEAYERLNKDNENKLVDALEIGNAYESDLLGWTKMTIGMYYTPNGNLIDLKGIEPNVKVTESKTDILPINLIEPLSATVKPSLGTQYMDVYYAECILKYLKYSIDAPDYTLDAKTVAAIKKFQKDSKVGSYGVLDFTTQKLLNVKLDTLKQKQDAVYAKAVEVLK
jgi:carboxyl-terminal processing protease